MKLSSTPKPIRFSFELDGRTYRSLDAIKADFKPFALKDKIDDGSFLRWLEQQNETELCNTIRNRDKVEVADVVEIVYGLTEEDIEKKLRDKHRKAREKERDDFLSYAIRINMLPLDVLEKCYLQFDPADSVWNGCKEMLEESKKANVINRLAAEYKREGDLDKYKRLIEYAAKELNDEYAKGQLLLLVERNYIDGVDVSKIRHKDDLIEVFKRKMSYQWYNLCNQKCTPQTTPEEKTFLELVRLCVDICKAINNVKRLFPNTYCPRDVIQNEYKRQIKYYLDNAENPMRDCADAIKKILDFSDTQRGMGFHLIQDLRDISPWNRIDLMTLQGRTDKPGVLMTILIAILQQDK